MSELKYFGCVLDESGTYVTECRRKVANGWEGGGRKVAGVIRSLVNAMGLQLEGARVLHETFSCLFCCIAVRQ